MNPQPIANKPATYCSLHDTCLTIPEWGTVFQISGVVVGLLVAGFGLYKTWEELKRLRQQREKDHRDAEVAARLKRTEFLLAQHRRLFDDSSLSKVLALLDADDPKLAEPEMWDLNRKFLTFIEEISLLVESELLDGDVAYYMFGYYATCARDGVHFNVGINAEEEHWRLFHHFCRNAEAFFDRFRSDLSLIPKI
jgi:hypothetical protein